MDLGIRQPPIGNPMDAACLSFWLRYRTKQTCGREELDRRKVSMKYSAKLAGSLTGARFKDTAEVALVGKARVGGHGGQISPLRSQRAAGKLDAFTIHEFGHGATVVLSKNTGKMNRMNANLRGNFLERQRVAVAFVQQLQSSFEPLRTGFFIDQRRAAHAFQHVSAYFLEFERAEGLSCERAIEPQAEPG